MTARLPAAVVARRPVSASLATLALTTFLLLVASSPKLGGTNFGNLRSLPTLLQRSDPKGPENKQMA